MEGLLVWDGVSVCGVSRRVFKHTCADCLKLLVCCLITDTYCNSDCVESEWLFEIPVPLFLYISNKAQTNVFSLLLLARLICQYSFVRWRLSSSSLSVTLPAGAWPVGRRHCRAGQYGYVPLERNLVFIGVHYVWTTTPRSHFDYCNNLFSACSEIVSKCTETSVKLHKNIPVFKMVKFRMRLGFLPRPRVEGYDSPQTS